MKITITWKNEEKGRAVVEKAKAEAEERELSQQDIFREVLGMWARGELIPAGASPRKRERKEET